MILTRRMTRRNSPILDLLGAFDELGGRTGAPGLAEGSFAMDISEADDALVVRADLPGFAKDEIRATIEEGVLTIEASHAEVTEESSGNDRDSGDAGGEPRFLRRERWYGAVSRRIQLPDRYAASEPSAALEHGVLTLRFPVAETSLPRTVSIG